MRMSDNYLCSLITNCQNCIWKNDPELMLVVQHPYRAK